MQFGLSRLPAEADQEQRRGSEVQQPGAGLPPKQSGLAKLRMPFRPSAAAQATAGWGK
jgi:hypothetical protein